MKRALALTCLLGILVACDSEVESAKATCPRVVWHLPSSPEARVSIVGDFNGWSPAANELNESRPDGYRVAEIPLGRGEQRYAIVEDGVWRLDRTVGTSAYYEGHEVTWVDAEDCQLPVLTIDAVTVSEREGMVRAILNTNVGAAEAELLEGEGRIEIATVGARVELHVRDLGPGRTRVAVRAKDSEGVSAKDVVATLWNEPTPFEFRDAIVYQVVTDRYRSDTGALASPATLADRAGGTLKGVEAAIRSGELHALGVNVLWLSPLYENPTESFPGADGHLYTGYHGYWPKAALTVDPRFGTEEDLRELIQTAHANRMRVIFDVVPNHVHEQHPYVKEHPEWFNGSPGACTCGQPGCDWAAHMQECWFAPYLPDLNWRNGEVATQISRDIAEWVSRFGADGVRIDAVPMMPRSATRRIAASLRKAWDHPGYKTWVIGENFTGPGAISLLTPYLGPDGLDTEFHFPLMWSLRSVIAEGQGAMSDIADTFDEGELAWAGAGATMGLMVGNHDVARFASVSVGDGGGDGWSEAALATDTSVFAKQALALGLVATLPGAPFLYYGDEIALTGRGDPDTRRVMPDGEALSSQALTLRDTVRRLFSTRAACDLLRRGSYTRLYADRERVAFARSIGRRSAVVTATRSSTTPADTLAIPLSPVAAGKYVDAVTKSEITVDPELTSLPSEAFSVRVYLPSGDACLSP